jgi:hypothetical protein
MTIVAGGSMSYEAPKARVEDHDAVGYRASASLAQWTEWALWAKLVVSVLAIGTGILERRVLMGSANEGEEALRVVALSSIAELLVFLVSGFLCLRWIHRMAHNARIRAAYLQYTPGWSIGWFFVPIAYWWKPYQAMKEIWGESEKQAGAQGLDGGVLLGWWWTLWIASSIISNASFRLSLRSSSAETLLTVNTIDLISNLLEIPLALVFIMMVRKLTSMQDYAHENPLAQAPDLRSA